MDEASSLIAVAEIAVAIAGFSGVATALGQRGDAHFWTAGQRARFYDLIVHSGIGLFASLVTLTMLHVAEPAADGPFWMRSSLIWAACACAGVSQGFLRGRTLPTPPGLERWLAPCVFAGFAALIALQIYNAVALRAFGPYLAALVGNLGFAFVQFMRMVVPRAPEPPPARD